MKQITCSAKGAELLDLPAALHRQGLDHHVEELRVVVDGPLVLVDDGQAEADGPGGLHLDERPRAAGGLERRFHGVDALGEGRA